MPREIEALKRIVKKFRIELTPPVSLDVLAVNIHSRYPHLAAKYLRLHIDTGQVLPPQQFINEYAGGLSAPLNNTFLHREQELKLLNQLNTSDITIVTGQPGVGKSKLSIQTMVEWKKSNPGYELYCISNKNESIIYDLNSHLLYGKA